jgi:enoyl-CoA hydratase
MITVSFDGPVATLTLDDGKGNALGTKMLHGLERALGEAERAQVVILRGREKVFCGGLDLPELQPFSRSAAGEFFELFDRVHERLLAYPRPIITCCRGSAIAGGAILLCAGDVRLATPGGKVGITESTLGFSFPLPALELVRVALGDERLTEAATLGRLYEGADRLRIGFVTEVAEAESIDARAREIAAGYAKTDVHAVAYIRHQLRRPALERVRQFGAQDRVAFLDRWFSSPAQAAVQAVVARLSAR